MFDIINQVFRMEIALIGTVVIMAFWLLVFPLELALILVVLPFMLIFMEKGSVRSSFVWKFPNSLRLLSRHFWKMWDWAMDI